MMNQTAIRNFKRDNHRCKRYKLHIWVDRQITTRIYMESLNTGLTAIIRSDVRFALRDTESDHDEPRHRSLQTTDGIPAA